jgi:hypothetical protein
MKNWLVLGNKFQEKALQQVLSLLIIPKDINVQNLPYPQLPEGQEYKTIINKYDLIVSIGSHHTNHKASIKIIFWLYETLLWKGTKLISICGNSEDKSKSVKEKLRQILKASMDEPRGIKFISHPINLSVFIRAISRLGRTSQSDWTRYKNLKPLRDQICIAIEKFNEKDIASNQNKALGIYQTINEFGYSSVEWDVRLGHERMHRLEELQSIAPHIKELSKNNLKEFFDNAAYIFRVQSRGDL